MRPLFRILAAGLLVIGFLAVGFPVCLRASLAAAAEETPTREILELIRLHALVQPTAEEERVFLSSGNTPSRVAGFLRRFDRYAVYLTAGEYRRFVEAQEAPSGGAGDVAGVGMDIVRDRSGEIVCIPYPGSAAERAGVGYGDRLLAVDGRETAEKTLEEIAALIRGQAGSAVSLKLEKPNWQKTVIAARRGKLTPASVFLERPGDGPLRVRVLRFGPSTPAALMRILEQAGSDGELILDLRGNTGGDLQASLDCLRLFMPKGAALLRVQSRQGERILRAEEDGPLAGTFVYLWQDELTASAAEVFIAAARGAGRAQSVGRPSAGKARAQELFRLSDGGLLKLTTERLLLPEAPPNSGQGSLQDWQDVGLRPDVELDSPYPAEELFLKNTPHGRNIGAR